MGLLQRLVSHGSRVAITAPNASPLSYRSLLAQSQRVAKDLELITTAHPPQQVRTQSPAGVCDSLGRVPLLAPSSPAFVSSLLGTWMARLASVPLCASHPPAQWTYFLEDSLSHAAVVHSSLQEKSQSVLEEAQIRTVKADLTEEELSFDESQLVEPDEDLHALSVYTSGTTGRPKGVVQSHRVVSARLSILHEAWGWQEDDAILCFLPLHHVHGLYNVVLNALWAGARVHMMPRFDETEVWNTIMDQSNDLSVFMAVPTIYSRLIAAYDQADAATQAQMQAGCQRLRLMISGSAALPASVMARWEAISGHRLLERYGMTEIGMALSNPLHGERKQGYVGSPLPTVDVRIQPPEGEVASEEDFRGPGELCVKGPSVFCGYWQKEEKTKEEFDEAGWFHTGDTTQQDADSDGGGFRILGRTSVDILKVAGFKISALDIERVLLEHPAIREVAVLGVDDAEYGQRIAAVISLSKNSEPDSLSLDSLRQWARQHLPTYQLPQLLEIVPDELPKNHMGKVNKKSLVKEFFGSPQ